MDPWTIETLALVAKCEYNVTNMVVIRSIRYIHAFRAMPSHDTLVTLGLQGSPRGLESQ